MKCLRLRFENYTWAILLSALFSVGMALASWLMFANGEIGGGVFEAVVSAIMLSISLWIIISFEVVIDFKHNRIKMRWFEERHICALDKVKSLDIVFCWVEKRKCYSANVKAFLKDGKSVAIKIYPKRRFTGRGSIVVGKVSARYKARIEQKVKDYDFITCRTEEK